MTRDEAKTEINNYGYTISEQNKIIDDIYDDFEKEKQELIDKYYNLANKYADLADKYTELKLKGKQ